MCRKSKSLSALPSGQTLLRHGVLSLEMWCLETNLTVFSILFRNKSWNKGICAGTGHLHHTDNPQVRDLRLSFTAGVCFELLVQQVAPWVCLPLASTITSLFPVLRLTFKTSHSVKLLKFPGDLLCHSKLRRFPSTSWSVLLEASHAFSCLRWHTFALCVLAAQLLGDSWLAFTFWAVYFPLPSHYQVAETAANSSYCFHYRLHYSSLSL